MTLSLTLTNLELSIYNTHNFINIKKLKIKANKSNKKEIISELYGLSFWVSIKNCHVPSSGKDSLETTEQSVKSVELVD